MIKGTISGVVVELYDLPNKDNKVFPELRVAPIGERFPRLYQISVKPEQMDKARQLVNKKTSVPVDIREYDGKTRYALAVGE